MKEFVGPIQKEMPGCLEPLFQTLEQIYDLAKKMSVELSCCINNSPETPDLSIAHCFIDNGPAFSVLSKYFQILVSSVEILQEINLNENNHAFLMKLQEEANTDFESMLVLPVQQLTKYEILLEEVDKHTDRASKESAGIQQAVRTVNNMVTCLNLKNLEYPPYQNPLSYVQARVLCFYQNLVTRDRELVHEGWWIMIASSYSPDHIFMRHSDLLRAPPCTDTALFEEYLHSLYLSNMLDNDTCPPSDDSDDNHPDLDTRPNPSVDNLTEDPSSDPGNDTNNEITETTEVDSKSKYPFLEKGSKEKSVKGFIEQNWIKKKEKRKEKERKKDKGKEKSNEYSKNDGKNCGVDKDEDKEKGNKYNSIIYRTNSQIMRKIQQKYQTKKVTKHKEWKRKEVYVFVMNDIIIVCKGYKLRDTFRVLFVVPLQSTSFSVISITTDEQAILEMRPAHGAFSFILGKNKSESATWVHKLNPYF